MKTSTACKYRTLVPSTYVQSNLLDMQFEQGLPGICTPSPINSMTIALTPRHYSRTSDWTQIRPWEVLENCVDVLFFLLQISHARCILDIFCHRLEELKEVSPSLYSSLSDDMMTVYRGIEPSLIYELANFGTHTI
jgi:hypothetical protein